MATVYPDALDDFDAFPDVVPPGAFLGNAQGGRTHVGWHRDLADAVLALQRKVGVNALSVTLTGGGTYERGQSVASVALAWSVSKPIAAQIITGPGVAEPDVADRTATAAGPFTTDATWSLEAETALGELASGSTSLVFRSRRWWGVSASASLDDAALLALTGELATARQQTRTLDATGGRYLWFAWPAEFGAPAMWVGGLLNTAWIETIRDHVNVYGATRSYRLYRSQYLQSASAIAVEVR